MSLLNTISICVWMTIAVILISALSKPLHNLFTFFMPAGAAFLVLAIFAPQLAEPKIYTTGMLVHIFVSLLAYSVMIVATLQAILVNIQSNHLHNHRFNNRISSMLPPLQSMERLMFEWLIIGFVLLTVAIVTGGLYVENMLAQHLIHKTALTLTHTDRRGLFCHPNIRSLLSGLERSAGQSFNILWLQFFVSRLYGLKICTRVLITK